MAQQTVTVRFGSGTEFWSTEHPPVVGETLVRSGRRYLVTHVEVHEEDAVVVTVAEQRSDDGSPPRAGTAPTIT